MRPRCQIVWRIAKHTAQYHATDMSGGGAKSTGGRWNSKGMPVVYAATSIALATLETLTRVGDNTTMRNAFLIRIAIPGAVWRKREIIAPAVLPPTWLAEPPGATTIDLGDKWLRSVSAPLLLVPSVIIPEEFNVLINPAHRSSGQITAEVVRQYIYDPRLKKCR
ncbi:RES family NAD+ phosphorylase [Massilia violaceinigra]|nr:RES family NAD+ phosphorylase [Massilia violaceinigra]